MIARFLTVLLFLPALSTVAQNSYERCATKRLIEYRESQNPGYQQSVRRAFNYAKDNAYNNRAGVYEIPVVVHIVYNDSSQNLADSIVHEQMASLNEDYRRENSDTVNMRGQFQPHVGDPEIQFRLADFDPTSNPTNGITRTQTSESTFLDFQGGGVAESVKSAADGGHDPWDQSRYLNIWVCNMEIPIVNQVAILGYATPPAGLPNWPIGSTGNFGDGVVIQYQAFGRNNPNPLNLNNQTIDVRGRTVTHEVGHYLGLRHIWGDSANCTVDDGIADTPKANDQSEFDCDATKNTCTDNIGGNDLDDMIENYMDYSAETCQNSFTKGQISLMRSVLENQRDSLIDNGTLNIESKNQPFTANIYPNPTSDRMTVELDQSFKSGQINVFNLAGQQVYQQKAQGSHFEISTQNWSRGTYIIKIKDNHGIRVNHKITVF